MRNGLIEAFGEVVPGQSERNASQCLDEFIDQTLRKASFKDYEFESELGLRLRCSFIFFKYENGNSLGILKENGIDEDIPQLERIEDVLTSQVLSYLPPSKIDISWNGVSQLDPAHPSSYDDSFRKFIWRYKYPMSSMYMEVELFDDQLGSISVERHNLQLTDKAHAILESLSESVTKEFDAFTIESLLGSPYWSLNLAMLDKKDAKNLQSQWWEPNFSQEKTTFKLTDIKFPLVIFPDSVEKFFESCEYKGQKLNHYDKINIVCPKISSVRGNLPEGIFPFREWQIPQDIVFYSDPEGNPKHLCAAKVYSDFPERYSKSFPQASSFPDNYNQVLGIYFGFSGTGHTNFFFNKEHQYLREWSSHHSDAWIDARDELSHLGNTLNLNQKFKSSKETAVCALMALLSIRNTGVGGVFSEANKCIWARMCDHLFLDFDSIYFLTMGRAGLQNSAVLEMHEITRTDVTNMGKKALFDTFGNPSDPLLYKE